MRRRPKRWSFNGRAALDRTPSIRLPSRILKRLGTALAKSPGIGDADRQRLGALGRMSGDPRPVADIDGAVDVGLGIEVEMRSQRRAPLRRFNVPCDGGNASDSAPRRTRDISPSCGSAA